MSDQTKTEPARAVLMPDVLVKMLAKAHPKDGASANLRKASAKACVTAKLGTLEAIDKNGNRRYHSLVIHDLRRSAIKNLMKARVYKRVAMAIGGHNTRAMFERYHFVDESDVVNAMCQVSRVSHGESLARVASSRPARKALKPAF